MPYFIFPTTIKLWFVRRPSLSEVGKMLDEHCFPIAHCVTPNFLLSPELLKEIAPELKHIFVRFRLETGH